jgi:glycosyltransferase involved in cell wall biosynthesis
MGQTTTLHEADADDQLRILRVTGGLYPEIMGGMYLHAHSLSKLQAQMGHEVTVLTSDLGDRTLPREEQRDGYTIRRQSEWASPFENSITPELVSTMNRLKDDYDVVHAHSHLYFATNITAALLRLDTTPFVVTNHGVFSQTAPDWFQKYVFLPTVARFTYNSADRVICYTDTDRTRLQKYGVRSDIAVIHNGINCSQFKPIETDPSMNQILFVGRLKKDKGVLNLFNAFLAIADDFPSATLKIVGDGPLYETLVEKRARHELTNRVVLTGALPNEQLPHVYNESAVFVLPSQNEGLPRTVLEAMACETPVVTSDLPQLQTLVDVAGYTVPSQSTTKLRAAIAKLLQSTELRDQMGKTGRERVVSAYSWKDTVRQTVNEYYKML